jgi:Leucine-rich repeat (LRR) protein
MEYNKKEYIASLKSQYGEFDKNFFIKENENKEIDTVVIVGKNVTSIDFICKCTTIRKLILAKNSIETIVPLYNLSKVVELDVSYNKLKSLFGVASNIQIEYLNAGNNQISECYSMLVGKELYEKELNNNKNESK